MKIYLCVIFEVHITYGVVAIDINRKNNSQNVALNVKIWVKVTITYVHRHGNEVHLYVRFHVSMTQCSCYQHK